MLTIGENDPLLICSSFRAANFILVIYGQGGLRWVFFLAATLCLIPSVSTHAFALLEYCSGDLLCPGDFHK